MPRARLLFLALLPMLMAGELAAQVPVEEPAATGSPRVGPAPAAAPQAAPAAAPGQPGQPAAAAPRRPRSYEQCRQIAFQRHYRGAERRHYMTRCQLGYGRPLFRRRGRVPGAVPAPGPAPAPQGHRPAPT
jgi:hypothetical protein